MQNHTCTLATLGVSDASQWWSQPLRGGNPPPGLVTADNFDQDIWQTLIGTVRYGRVNGPSHEQLLKTHHTCLFWSVSRIQSVLLGSAGKTMLRTRACHMLKAHSSVPQRTKCKSRTAAYDGVPQRTKCKSCTAAYQMQQPSPQRTTAYQVQKLYRSV